jgi:hypothetical protein
VIRITITTEAFEAVVATLHLGSVGYEADDNERNVRHVWLEARIADRLGAMRGPGESFSDAIIRIAGQEALATRRG